MIKRGLLLGCVSLVLASAPRAVAQAGGDLAPACGDPRQVANAGDAETAEPVELPIFVENGVVLVDAVVDGAGPLPMMVDTGAVNVVTPEVVADAGIRVEGGRRHVSGRAGRDTEVPSAQATELRLAAASLRDQPFLILDLPRFVTDRGNRPPIAGILGYEFFASFAVRLDYQKRLLTLASPGALRRAGVGVCVPFSLQDRKPSVAAKVDGVVGLFALDTGSNAGLTLDRGFVDKNGFDSGHASLRVKSAAVDGLVDTVVMRLGRFDFADATIHRPLAHFTVRPGEVPSSAAISGTIGSKILRQFVITFDYARRELWLERSSAFDELTSSGKTGFQAAKIDGAGLRVILVIPASPAALAGLKEGDLITAIDDTPAAAIGLAEMAELGRLPDGAVVGLRVLRDGSVLSLALALKELLP